MSSLKSETIRSRENELFAKWANRHSGFVKDGVVNEDAYLASAPKIMFVLKEVNDPNGGGWDLREFIAGGARPSTWDNITRWVRGIRHDVPWKNLVNISEKDRKETLKSICAINLKKTPGCHTTNSGELAIVAEQDQKLIQDQIALYEPDIVICCGTGSHFNKLIGEADWRSTSRGVSYRELTPGKFVIWYAHPEARVGASLLYYGLIDAIREITNTSLIVSIDRRVSAKKWSRLLEHVRKINNRWKFSIESNHLLCIRTWTGNVIYKIRFDEVRNDNRVLYTEVRDVTAHLEHPLSPKHSESSIRATVNLLIDEIIDPNEFL